MATIPYVPANHCLYLNDGKLDPHEPNSLDLIFAGMAKPTASKTLVVHFHGGLVARSDGETVAATLYRDCYGERAYPVFFIWESGLRYALQQSLPQIFGETVFRILLERVGQFAAGKIDQQVRRQEVGGRAAQQPPLRPVSRFYVKEELKKAEAGQEAFADRNPAGVPTDELLQPGEESDFLKALLVDPDLSREAAKIANGLRAKEDVEADAGSASRGAPVQGSATTLMSPDVIDAMHAAVGADVDSRRGVLAAAALGRLAIGGARALTAVVRRFARRRHHGVHATIVEEILREFYLANIGHKVWDTMKGDTLDAFGGDPAVHGGTAFLHRLKALWTASSPPLRVVLVGHSTGAVYICHFLRHAHSLLPSAQFDVIFLAPACDFKLFSRTLLKYHDRIAHFRLFGMRDELERAELLLDIPQVNAVPGLKRLYPGSLLYFVSGVLENEADEPLVGMTRFYSAAAPYDAAAYPEIEDVRAYFTAVPHATVWSKQDDGAGRASASVRHGDFDNDPLTLQSVAHLLQHGF